MTRLCLVFAFFICASAAVADDFKTNDGREYKDVTISRVEPDGIVVLTKSGVSKIYFSELPADVQRRFHYNAEKATLYTAEENRKLTALAQQQRTEAQGRAEERQKYWNKHSASAQSGANFAPPRLTPLRDTASPLVASERGPENCYIQVRNVESALEIQRYWETSWGSYDRDHYGRLVLNIRLGTVGNTEGEMKIQWYWIGRKLKNIQQLFVYGKGERTVLVPAKYFTECYAAAPLLKSHTLNLAALGERYVSGAQHEGWIVCATDPADHVLAEKASSESLLNLFNDHERFSELLRTETHSN